jgi:small subunit ribosomal protein S6
MSSDLRDYEMTVIANPTLDEEALAALNQKITGWITGANGTVAKVDTWGKRSLMYAIKRQTDGIYEVFTFQMEPVAARELDRSLRLEEQVIRHLVIRLDEK